MIDASIAGLSGEASPRGDNCRGFLDSVRDCKHRIVMIAAIAIEWRHHAARFSRTWLTSMWGRRQVDQIDVAPNEWLRTKLDQAYPSDKRRQAVAKDVHLVEAALETDRTIASRDEKARSLLIAAVPHVKLLGTVMWVNPVNDHENCVQWLQGGAAVEPDRQLGHDQK